MAIDVSFRDGYSTSAQDLSRFNKNFLINEGVANDGLKVSQSAVPAMSVQVIAGTSYFYGTGTTADTMFEFYSDSTETVTIPTASAQARIDIVCCKVDASTGVASLVVVSGTPSGSPAVPATPASHYKLANVAVGAGVTTITNANITDTRRSVFVAPTGARNQGLINGKIVPTVASNNLTLAIKTLQDTDPSPTNPVGIWIGNNLRWITSATSSDALAGTNWFSSGSAELATKPIDYFAYAQWDNSENKVNVGFARIPYARISSDFVADNVSNGLNEKYFRTTGAGITLEASDSFVNIGRFQATLSASPNFHWSVPTANENTVVQRPIFETRWLDWNPAFTGLNAMTYTSVSLDHARYQVIGRNININFRTTNGTTGGSADIAIDVSLPFNLNGNGVRLPAYCFDGAGNRIGWGDYNQNNSKIRMYKFETVNWGLGGNRELAATHTNIFLP